MMRRRKRKNFLVMNRMLPGVLRRMGFKDELVVYRAVTDWEKVVGAGIARHTQALVVEGKRLVVAVDSPAWMTQMMFLKGEILDKIARHIGAGRLTDIQFVLKREG